MLKLNAQFSKKVPVPGQDYSSKGYSAEISIELPDNLTQEQLQERIHNTFALVQASVEAELENNGTVIPAETTSAPSEATPVNGTSASPEANVKKFEAASPKQLKYVMDLVRESRYDTTAYLQSHGIKNLYELSRQQCSQLIDLIKEQQGKAA